MRGGVGRGAAWTREPTGLAARRACADGNSRAVAALVRRGIRTGLRLLCVVALALPAAAEELRDAYAAGWMGAKFIRPESGRTGIQVKELVAGGPAEQAGLQPRDVIVQLDGVPVNDVYRFLTAIKEMDPGTQVRLTVLRGEDSKEIPVTLGSMRVRPVLDQAMKRGVQWLVEQQREDGAWNTATPELVEGHVKASPRNTALILLALASLPIEFRRPHEAAVAEAVGFLERSTAPAGWVGDPTEVVRAQNYATSFAIQGLLRLDRERHREWIGRMVGYLNQAQLLDAAGASEFDWYYGAWNYWDEFRRSAVRGDLSVTSCVVEGLAAAGESAGSPGMRKALAFVKRCQNVAERPDVATPLDDGGFFFNPRNSKAGQVVLPGNRVRFRSYGSATCDGVVTLLALGVPREDPAVRAAAGWLARNYTLRENPGFSQNAPAPYWSGIFFYYYWGLTRALDGLGKETLTTPDDEVHWWAREAADWLANLQKPDGSWANEVNIMEENDPLVATPLALMALATTQKWVK